MATRNKPKNRSEKQRAADANRRVKMIGNKNAEGRGLWGGAVRRAVARAAKAKGEGICAMLDRIADALVQKGAEGDIQAIKEIGDRVDGKLARRSRAPA